MLVICLWCDRNKTSNFLVSTVAGTDFGENDFFQIEKLKVCNKRES